MTDLCLLLWSTRRRPLIKQRNAIKFLKFLRLIWYAGWRNQMNHETFQFNFAALDSKPAAEVLCAQLDAGMCDVRKAFRVTRLRLLNRLTVTRCYLRNLPMLWLPKFLPTKVYGSCHGRRDRQKVNLVFCDEKCSCLGLLSYPAVWLVRLAPRDASVIDIKACNRRSWSSWCGVHWIDPKWTKRRLFITLMTKIHLTL